MLKIAMLSTGEEVLHGDIVDTNAAWLSRLFFEQGLSLSKRSTVGDNFNALVEELMMLSFNSQVVIVNGGLGPTSDDLSAEAAARAADVELQLNQQWLQELEAFFAGRGKPMPESNRKQAMLPAGSVMLDNPIGTACGFKMTINDCVFYFTPGVPKEFKLMVEQVIIPDLKSSHPDTDGQACSRLYTLGSSESALSDKLDKLELPEGYQIGYRSYLPFIEVKLFGPKEDLDNRVKLAQLIFSLIEPYVVSVDEPMVSHLGHLIADKKQSIAISEQSTQGWLCNWLHSDPNAQSYCGHGWVLGSQVDLGEHEQDSLAAVFALAGATREKCATDIAVVTGKLHGDSFAVAISTSQGEWGKRFSFRRKLSAAEQKELIGTVAGDMLRRYLAGKAIFAHYSALESDKEMHVPSSAISQ
ncbi:CinA family nicotinamide mononucleotide deamidase-related protein [Vibrio sp.]|uniref:CinA family nicotinamide mononucleotide deamidase-related protein n=1 Tax=Vibrio sp. TaxID=678 RepID=UPI003D0F2EAD